MNTAEVMDVLIFGFEFLLCARLDMKYLKTFVESHLEDHNVSNVVSLRVNRSTHPYIHF